MVGVGATNRPGLADASWMTKMYYTLGLFMLGGLDLGVPEGGPPLARAMLWIAYFACPAVTTAAVVESALRVLDTGDLPRSLHDHIVVAGGGALTPIYLEALGDHVASHPVVVVSSDGDTPSLEQVRPDCITCLQGDPTNLELLKRLRISQAREVMLVTGDDFENLEIMQTIYDEFRGPEADNLDARVHTHVSNLLLLQNIEGTSPLQTNMQSLFNAHREAAEDLVHHRIDEDFRSTEAIDQLVLAGFGRFGQSMLWALHDSVRDEFDRVVIVDREAERAFRLFRKHVDWNPRIEYEVETVEGDMTDPETWERVDTHVRSNPVPVFVLGSDEDTSNIQAALWVTDAYGGAEANVYVRTLQHWHFADRLASAKGFRTQNITDLTRHAIREQSNVVDASPRNSLASSETW
jgi:voltage-gated potassium channel Kch